LNSNQNIRKIEIEGAWRMKIGDFLGDENQRFHPRLPQFLGGPVAMAAKSHSKNDRMADNCYFPPGNKFWNMAGVIANSNPEKGSVKIDDW
jgi:hypothetical protein